MADVKMIANTTEPIPNREPSFMERALSREPQAVAKVITAMANAEDEVSHG